MKPAKPAKAPRRVRRVRRVRRFVYRGWVTVNGDEALPKKVEDRTEIIFGSYKWRDEDQRCKITVEVYE
jgi:hypothetical protein